MGLSPWDVRGLLPCRSLPESPKPPQPYISSAPTHLGRTCRRCYSPALVLFSISEIPASHGRTARMDVVLGPRLLPLLVCAMVVAAGCASVKTDGPDTLSGVISPTERIKDLRDLAQNAATKNPTEKQMIAQQLAGDFQHEHDPLIRAQIVRTLAVYPGPLSDAVLHQAVKDPDNDVRTADCELWGQRGNADAAGTLAGILNSDTDHDVRIAAVRRWPMRTNRSPSWRWPAPWRTRTRQCRTVPWSRSARSPAKTWATTSTSGGITARPTASSLNSRALRLPSGFGIPSSFCETASGSPGLRQEHLGSALVPGP